MDFEVCNSNYADCLHILSLFNQATTCAEGQFPATVTPAQRSQDPPYPSCGYTETQTSLDLSIKLGLVESRAQILISIILVLLRWIASLPCQVPAPTIL